MVNAETIQTQTYELCDGVAGGYAGNAYSNLPPTPVAVPCEWLHSSAGTHRPCGYQYRVESPGGKEPMLTRSKIRELTHADWWQVITVFLKILIGFPGLAWNRITQRAILIVLFKGVLTFLCKS